MLSQNLLIAIAAKRKRWLISGLSLGVNVAVVLSFLAPGQIDAQVAPVTALREAPTRIVALTDATIITEPGKTIKKGTVLMRDGLIVAVGSRVRIPADATVISMVGKTIYPGFIESYWSRPAPTRRRGQGNNNQPRTQSSSTPVTAITRHWSNRVTPSQSALLGFTPVKKDLEALRKSGFTTAHLIPATGIFRGQTALVHLSDWDTNAPIELNIAQSMSFESGGFGDRQYPTSLLGAIALTRQTFLDAQWYQKAWAAVRKNPTIDERPEVNHDLDALGKAMGANKPFLYTTSDELAILRAGELAREFGLKLWIAGNGFEYRRLNAIKRLNAFIILPVAYPDAPEVGSLEDELQVSMADLRHWDQAPDNAARLAKAKIQFALTTNLLKSKADFKKQVARSVERGFPAKAALAAITTIPAAKFGISKTHGKLAKGFVANLVVTDGDYFTKDSKVNAVWIAGREYKITPDPIDDFRGSWTINFPLSGDTPSDYTLEVKGTDKAPKGHMKYSGKEVPLNKLKIDGSFITWHVPGDSLGLDGTWRFSGTILEGNASGTGTRTDGSRFAWTAKRNTPFVEEKKKNGKNGKNGKKDKKEVASKLTPLFPEGAFGRVAPPKQPGAILIKNATIWTSGPQGVLKGADLLIENGKIKAIGKNLSLPRRARGTVEIDGTGKHITAGLIDAHSHTALESINEGANATTAEVRTRDVVDSDDISIYRQLAGGLTLANGLHGSANPIGGQNVVFKLRWGAEPLDLIYKRAPQGIKFALGENVKRSRSSNNTRYPDTRLGVDQSIRDALQAAKEYDAEMKAFARSRSKGVPPRRDLQMDALVEVINGTRLVHAHSYVSSEILNLIRIADDYGFTIATLTHILEGYKVAKEIAEHGAGASTFADWWAYKFEVYDAIPYNGALMHEVGVVVTFNSDSGELARRLNKEAAKAVHYGGVSEEEALKFVTINAAIQLKIDKYVGSLEPGKDADFVIWRDHPLSSMTICEQTWIDGKKYFDINDDLIMRGQQETERAKLIQKALADSAGSGKEKSGGNNRRGRPGDAISHDHGIIGGINP